MKLRSIRKIIGNETKTRKCLSRRTLARADVRASCPCTRSGGHRYSPCVRDAARRGRRSVPRVGEQRRCCPRTQKPAYFCPSQTKTRSSASRACKTASHAVGDERAGEESAGDALVAYRRNPSSGWGTEGGVEVVFASVRHRYVVKEGRHDRLTLTAPHHQATARTTRTCRTGSRACRSTRAPRRSKRSTPPRAWSRCRCAFC